MVRIRQLIDVAIGFPPTGQVNFAALHCLLICVTEKLGIADDTFDYNEISDDRSQLLIEPALKKQTRLMAGLATSEDKSDEKVNEPDENSLAQALEEEHEKDNDLPKEEETEAAVEAPNVPDAEQQDAGEITAGTRDSDLTELPLEKSNARISELANSPEVAMAATHTPAVEQLEVTKDVIDESLASPEDLLSGISALKPQLELAVEQLLLLTFVTLSRKPPSDQIQQLYDMAQTLSELKKASKPMKGLPFDLSLNWTSSNLKPNEEVLAENVSASCSQDTLEGHLCYSPAKLFDQLMNLKTDFCLLTNNVNDLSSRLLQQESHHLPSLAPETHKQIRDLQLANVDLKETHSRLELRVTTIQNNVENLKRSQEDILHTMVDKNELEMQLDNKVDYSQLQAKASLDQILELQCRLDNRFAEISKRFSESDKTLADTVESLKSTLGPTAVEELLAKFKETISNDMQRLNELLRNYVASTNDECAAAGARVKVRPDLVCLSCNTDCVMPVREKVKLAKLPSAHASNIISPLVTYELGSIRKSGIMGYYRREEFPHSPNAWLARQSPAVADLKQSPARAAGGQHTPNSARERFQSTLLNRK